MEGPMHLLFNLASRRWVRSLAVGVVCLVGLSFYLSLLDPKYPIKDWLFWQLLILWSYCAVLNVACLAFGHPILFRWLKVRDRPALETLITSVAVGLVAFTMVMFVAGALSLYRIWFAVALPIGMLVAGGPSLLRLVRLWRADRAATRVLPPWTDILVKAAIVAGVILVGFAYLQCMTPAALNYDSRWYHLTIAQDYAREGRIVAFPADYNKSFPHLASIVNTWGFLLPGLDDPLRWMLALHLEFCLLLWALAGVGATAAWLVERTRVKGAWAAFFLFPIIFDYDSNLGGGADHFVGFFAAPVFLAAVRAARDLSPRHCALVGVLAAGAVLSKYQAIYLVVPIAILMVWRWFWLSFLSLRSAGLMARLAQLGRARLWRGPLILVMVGALLTAPHFLKNWIFYRNPLYPFMTEFFAGSRPRQPDSPILVTYMLTGDGTIQRPPWDGAVARKHIGDEDWGIGLPRPAAREKLRHERIQWVPIEDPILQEVGCRQQRSDHDKDERSSPKSGAPELRQPRHQPGAAEGKKRQPEPPPDHQNGDRDDEVDGLVFRQHCTGGQHPDQGAMAGRQISGCANRCQKDGCREEPDEVIGSTAQIAVVVEDDREQEEGCPRAFDPRTLDQPGGRRTNASQGPKQKAELKVQRQHPTQGIVQTRQQEAPGVHDAGQVRERFVVVCGKGHDAAFARIVLGNGQVIPARVVVESGGCHALQVREPHKDHAGDDRRLDQDVGPWWQHPGGGAVGAPKPHQPQERRTAGHEHPYGQSDCEPDSV